MAAENDLELPEGFRPLECQVAGHTFTDHASALGMLMQGNGDYVLKPLGKPECGKRELNFYETLQNNKEPMILKLKDLVPKYYNKVSLIVKQREHVFIKLENLTSGMRKPCVMDIKIGRRTWDPLATPEKRTIEEQKYIKCKQSLGLCLPGFQMYNENDAAELTLVRYGKDYGKQLDVVKFRETIAKFLNSQHPLAGILIDEVLRQLYAIRCWFATQRIYHFYATSILIVYDADNFILKKDNNTIEAQNTLVNGHGTPTANISAIPTTSNLPSLDRDRVSKICKAVKVRMIDFAHVFPAELSSLDTNYQFGLHNLISIIENLRL